MSREYLHKARRQEATFSRAKYHSALLANIRTKIREQKVLVFYLQTESVTFFPTNPFPEV